jgi:DNA-binding protein H-NS
VQSEEGRVIHSLQELLARGRDLRIKDLKQMLDQFQQERESRQAQAGERREEIQRKLQSYRLARSHGAQPIPPSGTARISMKEE